MERVTRRIQAQSVPLAPAFGPAPRLGVLRLLDDEWERAGAPREAIGLLDGAHVALLPGEVAMLGRGLENDVVLTNSTVSREHARLVLRQGSWWVENISERSPLWVSDLEVPPGGSAPVPLGARLGLGRTTLQLLAPPAISAHETLPLAPIPFARAAQPAGSTGILRPGVTLQYALKGRVSATTGWALAALAAVLFLICALLTLGTAALIGQGALEAAGPGHVLASIIIPLIPALGVSVLVALLDRYEREPVPLLFAAFLWGAVIAIPPVLYVERRVSAMVQAAIAGAGTGDALWRALAQALNAGITEEAIKGAGLLLLLWVVRDEFDNVTDGVLYGALIGAGFAMVENYVYFAVSPRGDLGFLILGRIVLGWLSHSTFTACFGAGLGFAREMGRRRKWRWLAPALGLTAGMLLHTLFDAVAFVSDVLVPSGAAPSAGLATAALLLEYAPLFAAELALLRVVLASLEREAEVVREYLAGEVLAGVVSPDEYALAQEARLRAAAERHYFRAYGLRAYLTARALFQTETGLAFRAWHVAQGDGPKPTLRQPEDAYRARIARLRRSLLRQVRARQNTA